MSVVRPISGVMSRAAENASGFTSRVLAYYRQYEPETYRSVTRLIRDPAGEPPKQFLLVPGTVAVWGGAPSTISVEDVYSAMTAHRSWGGTHTPHVMCVFAGPAVKRIRDVYVVFEHAAAAAETVGAISTPKASETLGDAVRMRLLSESETADLRRDLNASGLRNIRVAGRIPVVYARGGRMQAEARHDPRMEPHMEMRAEPRMQPRMVPRKDPRRDLRRGPQMDLRMEPRREFTRGPIRVPAREPRMKPRMEFRTDGPAHPPMNPRTDQWTGRTARWAQR